MPTFRNESSSILTDFLPAPVPGYQQSILDFTRGKLFPDDELDHRRLNVVLVACGGSRVCAADVDRFERDYGLGSGTIFVDGKSI